MNKIAFINVYDKKGVVEFADGLRQLDYEVYSAASTLKLLNRSDVQALPIKGELLETAVKAVSGIEGEDIPPNPHMVVADLYPLDKIVEQDDFNIEELREYLDCANSNLIRSAAKNFKETIIICDRNDYVPIFSQIAEKGDISYKHKMKLAAKAYNYCAYYDGTVSKYLSKFSNIFNFGDIILALKKQKNLYSGENEGQRAAFYSYSGYSSGGINSLKVFQGRNFNANHYLDINLASAILSDISETACLIVRHGHIYSMAFGKDAGDNFILAAKGIKENAPRTAVFNSKIDIKAAKIIAEQSLEAVCALDYSKDALSYLKSRKRLKILLLPPIISRPNESEFFSLEGGLIIQEKDIGEDRLEFAGARKSSSDLNLAKRAWKIAKNAKSYCAIFLDNFRILAIADGQADSEESVNTAIGKIKKTHPILEFGKTVVFTSDMPLNKESLKKIADSIVSIIIIPAPETEKQKKEFAAICGRNNITLIFAGSRHLKR